MAVERRRKSSVSEKAQLSPLDSVVTSPQVIEQRRKYFQLWRDLKSTDLSVTERVDKEAHLLWLDVSLGFVSPIEHKLGLTHFYDQLEKSNNQEALNYLDNDVENMQTGKILPRMLEIRSRVLTEDQLSRIRAIIR